MSKPPAQPKIFHITHVENLPGIIEAGALFSHASMIARGNPQTNAGISRIKERRIHLPVTCHPGTCVGGYVPFYFCPRSIMLYVIHRGNPDLDYRGGQDPMVHLQADLHEVVQWARNSSRRWAFSLSNAGASYASFRCSLPELDQIDWEAVNSRDFSVPKIKEGKQAELLVEERFPWNLVELIGGRSQHACQQVLNAMSTSDHQPIVKLQPTWYY